MTTLPFVPSTLILLINLLSNLFSTLFSTHSNKINQLLYFDGVIEKKVPKGIYVQPRKSVTEGGSEGLRCDHPIFVPLIKGKNDEE